MNLSLSGAIKYVYIYGKAGGERIPEIYGLF